MGQNHPFNKKDFFVIVIFASTIFVFCYYCLGFFKNGISSPLVYCGDDDFFEITWIKSIIDNRRFDENKLLGMPFGLSYYDFPAVFLCKIEYLSILFLSIFSKNPYVVFNLQFLWTIAFCFSVSYFVLRKLGINTLFAIIGSIIFGLSPYIFFRGLPHYSLAACYFVPLSILICSWATEEDERYLSIKNGFISFIKYKKNIALIIISFLIANNGIGYYAFFTCFFLCATGVINIYRRKNLFLLKAVIIPTLLILLFTLMALIPVFKYLLINGNNNITTRSVVAVELYSLKISQLFIPTTLHHSKTFINFVNIYNASAPLVNNNKGVYLGVFGCVGFVFSIFNLLIYSVNKKENQFVLLLSKLNISAVLFFTIGGFISLFCFFLNFYFLRGFNRVSIFINYISIIILCYHLQCFKIKIEKVSNIIFKITGYLFLCFFCLYCIWEQAPDITINNFARREAKRALQNDKNFIKEIEKILNENDAVFQLPYHPFPEHGSIRGMRDYHLFAGYISSNKLRWSYGGMKGRVSDKWNKIVSSLPCDDMINAIISYGFRGIYIDARAYDQKRFMSICGSIENTLEGEKPIISSNNYLFFYNLYPFIDKHPELLSQNVFDFLHMEYSLGKEIFLDSKKYNADIYIDSGLSYPEDDFTWTNGRRLKMEMKITPVKKVCAQFDLASIFNGSQKVIIKLNGKKIITKTISKKSDLIFTFDCPKDGIIDLVLEFPEAVSPQEIGISRDPRDLALAIKKIILTREE